MGYIAADRGGPSQHPNHPYSPPLASSASSSASSIFSMTASVSSAASSVISLPSFHCPDQNSTDSVQWGVKDGNRHTHPIPLRMHAPLPAEHRQHPRRTRLVEGTLPSCVTSEACSMPPVPALVRQTERKIGFVDGLVDSAAQIVETIWPAYMKSESSGGKGVILPLRTFIQETLRRSRTSYSTLQVALYYLIIIRPQVPKVLPVEMAPEMAQRMRALQCGRRMFLAALILASKYLQDRNYSARAWSRISGLQTAEININEMAFLEAVSWRLHISETNFQTWTELVNLFTEKEGSPEVDEAKKQEWGVLILTLSPDLREGLPTLQEARKKQEMENTRALAASIQCVLPQVPVQKVPVSSLLTSDMLSMTQVPPTTLEPQLEPQLETSTLKQTIRLSNAAPSKTPAARLTVGVGAMACAAATAQMGQLQRCATEDMGAFSRRAASQRRSSLSMSMSSSPETIAYSDSSTNSSPSRFPLSRSSSISSASSVDAIIPYKIAARLVAGKKFTRVPISCNETILESESPSVDGGSIAVDTSVVSHVNVGLNTPTPSPPKRLALRLKPTSSPVCCSRKRQRCYDHDSSTSEVPEISSGVTPHLKAQFQMRTPPEGSDFKRLRCGAQEASTVLSVHGYTGNEEVS